MYSRVGVEPISCTKHTQVSLTAALSLNCPLRSRLLLALDLKTSCSQNKCN